MLKTYSAEYNWYGSWGCYQEYYAIIIANTASEALGFALQTFEDTVAQHWTIEEIATDYAHVVYLTSATN